MTEGGKP